MIHKLNHHAAEARIRYINTIRVFLRNYERL